MEQKFPRSMNNHPLAWVGAYSRTFGDLRKFAPEGGEKSPEFDKAAAEPAVKFAEAREDIDTPRRKLEALEGSSVAAGDMTRIIQFRLLKDGELYARARLLRRENPGSEETLCAVFVARQRGLQIDESTRKAHRRNQANQPRRQQPVQPVNTRIGRR